MSNSADGSSSDSNSDDGMDDSSMRFEDIVLRGSKSAAGQNNPGAQWTFRTHSDRSAQMFGNLNKLVVPNADFQLQFNAVDALQLSKTKAEIKHSLAQVRLKVFDSNNREKNDPAVAFAGALPYDFIKHFNSWLKAGEDAQSESLSVSFGDIVEFLRCEIAMRCHGILAGDLKDHS